MSGAPGLNISPYALDPSYLPTVCDSVMVGKCVCVCVCVCVGDGEEGVTGDEGYQSVHDIKSFPQ